MSRPLDKVPLGAAALERRETADRVRRRIQAGELAGVFEDGRWYVLRPASERPESTAPLAA